MAFALFYNDEDLAAIARQIVRSDFSANLKATATIFWNDGFKDWRVCGGAPYVRVEGDWETNALVISSQLHLADFANFLDAIANAFPNDYQAQYMAAIADDIRSGTMGNNSAAQEPYQGG